MSFYKFIRNKIQVVLIKKKWRKINSHNYTSINKKIDFSLIKVGYMSYGIIDFSYWKSGDEKLIIGNYVSIASGVKFLLGGEHRTDVITTYPFRAILNHDIEAFSKGGITVEDFVWIGTDVLVLSGVRIGTGAIIAAGAIVTKNVPPYSVVAGNPARVVKYRFSEEIRNNLSDIDFHHMLTHHHISFEELYKIPTLEYSISLREIYRSKKID